MGKPFAIELSHIQDTLRWVQGLDVSPLAEFLSQANSSPLITIGAGGSFTAAELARLMFESRGGIGITHTPLSFLQSDSDLRNTHIVLFTAGGNNRDVLAAFHAAVAREAKAVLVVCAAIRSKIAQSVARYPRSRIFTLPLPTGKDGFLATNSLAASSATIIRAFGHELPSHKTIRQIIKSADNAWRLPVGEDASKFYLAIYADWSRPAAIDLESKFSEAALGGVLLADYRNFAHGRHNWIDKQGPVSTVIAFITPLSAVLADKTLRLLPPTTRILTFKTETPGPAGALELILRVFCYTAFIGARRGIDPGRPGVPSYGGRIFRLGPVTYSKSRRSRQSQLQAAAVSRKLAVRGTVGDAIDCSRVTKAFLSYSAKLQESQFGALVADFDGTTATSGIADGPLDAVTRAFFIKLLKNRIAVYFATGRGDSIHRILQASFPPALWDRLFVSYYNGAATLPFSESSTWTEDCLPDHPALNPVFEQIQRHSLLMSLAKSTRKRCQLTLKLTTRASVGVVSALVREIVAKHARAELRVVQSTHSIDVIPLERTKLACVELAQSRLPLSNRVLTLGDCGSLLGNDFDLLTHPFSLSVDTVSTSLDCCWNLLPPGICNTVGLACYGSWIRTGDGYFSLRTPRIPKAELSKHR